MRFVLPHSPVAVDAETLASHLGHLIRSLLLIHTFLTSCSPPTLYSVLGRVTWR
jgi:hypothetical protein